VEYATSIQFYFLFHKGKKMLKSLPNEVPEMDILDIGILNDVADMAKGMTKEEILAGFSINIKDFSTDEQIFFNEFYAYGKAMGIRIVVNNLVDATKGRQGQPAAIAYLRRFAKEFEKEIEGDSDGSFSFSFGKKNDLKVIN
jgi:hypothetical protein